MRTHNTLTISSYESRNGLLSLRTKSVGIIQIKRKCEVLLLFYRFVPPIWPHVEECQQGLPLQYSCKVNSTNLSPGLHSLLTHETLLHTWRAQRARGHVTTRAEQHVTLHVRAHHALFQSFILIHVCQLYGAGVVFLSSAAENTKQARSLSGISTLREGR